MPKITGPIILDIVKGLFWLYRYLTRLKKKREATDSQDKKNLQESNYETQTNVTQSIEEKF